MKLRIPSVHMAGTLAGLLALLLSACGVDTLSAAAGGAGSAAEAAKQGKEQKERLESQIQKAQEMNMRSAQGVADQVDGATK